MACTYGVKAGFTILPMQKTGRYADEALLLPIDIDPEPVEERLTAWGGAALLIQAMRSFDVPGSTKRHIHIKQRQRGYSEGEYVESLLVLQALGGDCVDDLERLRVRALARGCWFGGVAGL